MGHQGLAKGGGQRGEHAAEVMRAARSQGKSQGGYGVAGCGFVVMTRLVPSLWVSVVVSSEGGAATGGADAGAVAVGVAAG